MATISSRAFGTLAGTFEPDLAGAVVTEHLLKAGDTEVRIIDFGATITSVKFHGKELTLCFPELADLEDVKKNPFFGCTVGRYANRIAAGEFRVDGVAYTTPITFRGQSSHGGIRGWNRYIWRMQSSGVRVLADGASEAFVTFEHHSDDGNEGFPGAVHALATYSLSSDNALGMLFEADTTRATPVNMCNHAYWNMSGDCARGARGHALTVYARAVVDVHEVTQIPTGALLPTATTLAFDFRSPRVLSDTLDSVTGGEQVGYDHSFVVSDAADAPAGLHDAAARLAPRFGACGGALRPCATLEERAARMHVYTTQPCVHLYTTNFLRGDAPYTTHAAVCLETQAPPDCVNRSELGCGDAIVRPRADGAAVPAYRHATVHVFERAE